MSADRCPEWRRRTPAARFAHPPAPESRNAGRGRPLIRPNLTPPVWALARAGAFCCVLVSSAAAAPDAPISTCALPPEGRATLQLIRRGGPFPYAKDGSVFGNYEQHLPRQARGYYREYTVSTPGLKHRGARRIVSGRCAPCTDRTSGEYYYTADHYRSFRPIREDPACPTQTN